MPALKTRLFAALWLVYSAYMAVQVYVMQARFGPGMPWAEAISTQFLYGGLWLALTPLILLFARRIPFRKGRWPVAFVVHFLLGIAVAVVQAWLFTFIIAGFKAATGGPPVDFSVFFRRLASFFDYGIHLYWLVIVLDHVHEYYFIARRHELNAATLGAQLAQARLRALTMQIRPHFLFNTLNAISVLVRSEPETARSMIAHLAALLRQTLSMTEQQEVSLGTEIDFLRHYLEIEKTRFSDRLSVDIAVDPGALDALVPAMILQPLVENAVKHGVSKNSGAGTISVTGARRDGLLRLAVRNNGGGWDGEEPPEGIGLSNTRSRLRHLYGDRQEFSLRSIAGNTVVAEVTIPFHTAKEET
jgi:two-component system LytT family sensor kinase